MAPNLQKIMATRNLVKPYFILTTVSAALAVIATILSFIFIAYQAGMAIAIVPAIGFCAFAILWFALCSMYTIYAWFFFHDLLREQWRIALGFVVSSLTSLIIGAIIQFPSYRFKHWTSIAHSSKVELSEFKPVIDAYANDPEWRHEVVGLVARNPKASPGVLSYLASRLNDNHDFMLWIAENPNTPQDVLDRCFRIPACHLYLAKNPSASETILIQLARSEDQNVRAGVAWNPSTPREILEQLTHDNESWVGRCAKQHLVKMK